MLSIFLQFDFIFEIDDKYKRFIFQIVNRKKQKSNKPKMFIWNNFLKLI